MNFLGSIGTLMSGSGIEQLFSEVYAENSVVHMAGKAVSFFFFMHFFSGTKHPREDNPNLYYWAEMTGLHTQTFNI